MRPLPPPRTPGRYRIGVVCLGNICRSPVADVVLSARVAAAGLDAAGVEVASCGTGGWHVGDPMDRRSAATLRAAGYDPERHRAQQLDAAWFERDLLLAMDAANLRDLRADPGAALLDDPARVRLFRDHDPEGPGEVPDPYYGGADGFALVLAMVERTAAAIVADLPRALAIPTT